MRNFWFPLFHTTVGFDRLLVDRFDRTSGLAAPKFLPHEIEKPHDDHGRIIVTRAGFQSDDVEVVRKKCTLVAAGQRHSSEDVFQTLHRGIATLSSKQNYGLGGRNADCGCDPGVSLADGQTRARSARGDEATTHGNCDQWSSEGRHAGVGRVAGDRAIFSASSWSESGPSPPSWRAAPKATRPEFSAGSVPSGPVQRGSADEAHRVRPSPE
mgnify:CR=1 FL=1